MKGLQFLNPIMLGGLLVLAVPVIIHLISRIKAKRIDFSTIRFLEQIKIEASRMERLRHLLLLLLRILLIAFIVFAFARPFFSNKTGKWTTGGTKAAVIILDNSYSMGYKDTFARAVKEAIKIAKEYGPNDKLAVITGSERPKALLQMTDGARGAENAILSAGVSNLSTDFEPGIRLAEEMLMETAVSKKTIYLITDNQESGWSKFDFKQKLSPGVFCQIVKVRGNESENSNDAVVGVELISEGGRLFYNKLKAKVVSFSKEDTSLKVVLSLDGNKTEKKLNLKPRQSGVVEFAVDMKLDKPHQGSVTIEDNGLKQDNTYYFAVNKASRSPVLVLSDGENSGELLYLKKALCPLETKGLFDIKEKNIANFNGFEGEKFPVVILIGTQGISGGAIARLKKFAEEGGSLIVVPSGNTVEADLKKYNSLFKEILPAELNSIEGSLESRQFGYGLSPRMLDNPLLEGMTDPKHADWSSISVIKYIKTGKENGNVILSFDNGDAAFIEKQLGKGRTIFFSSALDGTWNNFVLAPVFLPFIHQMVYTASLEETDGGTMYFPGDSLSATSQDVASISTQSGKLFISGAEAEETGVYKFTKKDKSTDFVAINVKGAEEGNLIYGSTDEKEVKLKNPAGELKVVANSLEFWTKKEEEEKTKWWWYLALVALLAGTLEMMLANYRGK